MSDPNIAISSEKYTAREVVGVFSDEDKLNAAVEQLGIGGVDRAAISVLGTGGRRPAGAKSLVPTAAQMADDPASKQGASLSDGSLKEGEAMAVAVPLGVGAFAGAWAVAAAGGALAIAIGATVVGGVLGAGLGGLLYYAVAHRHAVDIENQVATGGLILWVSTPDQASEERALKILRSGGGMSVHAHSIARHWGVTDSPLNNVQPDPFLEHDPQAEQAQVIS
jgi:hypothetical protein